MLIFSNIAIVSSALHIIFYLTTCGEVLRRNRVVLGSCRRSGVREWKAARDYVRARDLELVTEQGSCVGFPKKHGQGRHPKIPCILVPALGWRKLFTLSIFLC